MARKSGARAGHKQQQQLQAALAAFEKGRADETAALCATILKHKPREPNALHLLGVAYLTLGQIPDAAETLHKASLADPANVEIWVNLGAALRAGEQLEAAEASLGKAIALNAAHLNAHFNLGNVLSDAGRMAEAAACFRTALGLDPSHAGAHNNLGLALGAQGESDEAESCFRAAIAVQPDFRDALRNLAQILRDTGRLADSLTQYQAAIRAMPVDFASMNDCAVVLFELERTADAIDMLQRALVLGDDCLDARINLGNILCAADRPADAVEQFRHALALDARCTDAMVNMGHAYRQLGDLQTAIETYEGALAIDADHDEAWFGMGFCHLLAGRFEAGWRGYRQRESMRDAAQDYHRDALAPDLAGQRILVVFDQGIGDEVFFLRFLPALARRGADIAYLPDARLGAMFERSGIAEIVTAEQAHAGSFDLRLSVGDLPYVLGPDAIGDTPPSIALAPLAEPVESLRRRLAGFGPPPYIGVTWRAGTRGRQSLLYKESPAARMAAALAPLEATIVALQRAPKENEVEEFSAALGRELCDLTQLNDDIEDMLAVVGLLDDYVCVSNTNVHLAAAQARTCRLLIPSPPEFRWMAEGDESPWFPGMTIHRQAADGDWSKAFEALSRDLRAAFPPG